MAGGCPCPEAAGVWASSRELVPGVPLSGRGLTSQSRVFSCCQSVVSEAKRVTVSFRPGPAVQIAPGELALVCSLRKMVRNDWVSTVTVRWRLPRLRKGRMVIVQTCGLYVSGPRAPRSESSPVLNHA